MISREQCRHLNISFGSGDYYIFCNDCPAKWVAHNDHQPEYGYEDGKAVGADASVSNQYKGTDGYAVHDDTLRQLALNLSYIVIKHADHTQWFKSLAALCTYFGSMDDIIKLKEGCKHEPL